VTNGPPLDEIPDAELLSAVVAADRPVGDRGVRGAGRGRAL